MRPRRTKRGCEQASRGDRDWGVVLTHARGGPASGPTSPWVGAWVDLSGRHPQHSIELDIDREHTLTALGWDGARRCFGDPGRILVLDEATRQRVLAVVPDDVEVVVVDHAGLRELRRALEGEDTMEPTGRIPPRRRAPN